MNQVAMIIGYGTIVSAGVLAAAIIVGSVHDRIVAHRWRLDRMRAEHYARCDERARDPRSRRPA